MNVKTGKKHSSSYRVVDDLELLLSVQSFAGNNELNGHWEDMTFWGTVPAVAQVRAYCRGYLAAHEDEHCGL